MLGNDVTNESSLPGHSIDNSMQNADNSRDTDFSNVYKDIIGTKCRAPYTHDWGSMGYHNALIVGIDEQTDLEIPKVIKHWHLF